MKWNDNRIMLVGSFLNAVFLFFVYLVSKTDFNLTVGILLALAYQLFVFLFAERVRLELLPDGLTIKEAGWGDREYSYLEDKYND
jgi:hypothetical protein